MANGLLAVASAFLLALAGALGHYVVSFLRKPDHVKDHAAILKLIDDLLTTKRWNTREGRVVLEEACGQLYSRVISIHELRVLMRCESPSRAIRTYLKYRMFLEECKQKRSFTFKKRSTPFRRVLGLRVPVAAIKGVAVYSFFAVLALYGADVLTAPRPALLSGGSVNSMVILVCAWLLVMSFALFAVGAVLQMFRLLGAESELIKDLGICFSKLDTD